MKTGRFLENLKKETHLSTPKNSRRRDYRSYEFEKSDWVLFIGSFAGILGIIAYVFYRSIWACICFLPLAPVWYRLLKNSRMRSQKRKLKVQFKDALQSISSGLQAGYSVENAILEAQTDMRNMYGEKGLITKELENICVGLRLNLTAEELFLELAKRSGIEDIRQFGQIFAISKRTGGDLTSVLRICGENICEKIETEEEIRTTIAAKCFEGRIMDVVPCLIILYVDMTSPGFFDCLYHNAFGVIIMTVCLAIYLGAVLLSERMMRIVV